MSSRIKLLRKYRSRFRSFTSASFGNFLLLGHIIVRNILRICNKVGYFHYFYINRIVTVSKIFTTAVCNRLLPGLYNKLDTKFFLFFFYDLWWFLIIVKYRFTWGVGRALRPTPEPRFDSALTLMGYVSARRENLGAGSTPYVATPGVRPWWQMGPFT